MEYREMNNSINVNTYEVHDLNRDVVVFINAISPEQALLLVDFHENKESLLKLLPSYIKNNDIEIIKERHVFYYGKLSVSFGDWCVSFSTCKK